MSREDMSLRRVLDERRREHGSEAMPSTAEAEAEVLGIPTNQLLAARRHVPGPDDYCTACGYCWPCGPALLAKPGSPEWGYLAASEDPE